MALRAFHHWLAEVVLRTDLKHSSGFVDFGGYLAGLVDGVAHRFFEIDVVALIERIERDRAMPMVGRGDDHRVYIRPREHFAVVEGRELGLRSLLRHPLAFLIDVAHGCDLQVAALLGHAQDQAHQAAATSADTDQADVDAVVGPNHPACRRPGGCRRAG